MFTLCRFDLLKRLTPNMQLSDLALERRADEPAQKWDFIYVNINHRGRLGLGLHNTENDDIDNSSNDDSGMYL